ncbi:ATP-binding protein [Actinoallomurus spadix]|uniref:ATP-dependent nuclease n=1 Tax=Actinoallomurus spadix TaxID=79912 RepID=UPI002091F8C5|nr:AAA family ATPase [Actinoallomurus spadix]MCO5989939.1 ATP-binding protein [Actinoallomurus spadix]
MKTITLLSGDVIEVSSGVTAIVGPNNAGKSLFLREIQGYIGFVPGRQQPTSLIGSIELEPRTSVEEAINWLHQRYERLQPGLTRFGQIFEPAYHIDGQIVAEPQLGALLQSQTLGQLVGAYALHLNAEGRLGMTAGQTSSFDLLHDRPVVPAQHLYKDRDLEQRISELMTRAFGESLTVNRYAGSVITLHVGSVSAEEAIPPSHEYLQQLNALPELKDQGDGIRAFVGILLAIETAHFPLLIIDEPEAFLHPPQAYLLGKMLSEKCGDEVQIIVATHSQEILQGLTSGMSKGRDVSIVRLVRDGPASNRAYQVASQTIRDLYEDPLVKYYGILGGLFYQGTVLCEADSDCTYYRAVLDSLEQLPNGMSTSVLSLHFTHCGGKDRLPKAVKALRAAEVPVCCVVDIDFLQEDKDFNALVDSCGGDVEALTPRRNDVLSAVRNHARKVRRAVAESEINMVLKAGSASELSSKELREISKSLRVSSGWREAKLYGRSLFSGQALISFDILCEELRKIGIFVVEVGELERFHRDVSADNKAVWLRTVLERNLPRSSDAKDFVAAIALKILAGADGARAR